MNAWRFLYLSGTDIKINNNTNNNTDGGGTLYTRHPAAPRLHDGFRDKLPIE